MIALGEFRIYEQWLPGISCSVIRVTCKNNFNDATVEGRKQLVMFLSLDMQSSIVDAIRSMLDGMSEKQISKVIDAQLNVAMYITQCTDTYNVSLRPARRTEPFIDSSLWLETEVNKQILDIVCKNMEVTVKRRMDESKIIAL